MLSPSGGIKFRIGFADPVMQAFGSGCKGTGGFVPAIEQGGSLCIGSKDLEVRMRSGRPAMPAVLSFGVSRRTSPLGPLPLSLGGGCALRVSNELALPTTTTGTGAGSGRPLVLR